MPVTAAVAFLTPLAQSRQAPPIQPRREQLFMLVIVAAPFLTPLAQWHQVQPTLGLRDPLFTLVIAAAPSLAPHARSPQVLHTQQPKLQRTLVQREFFQYHILVILQQGHFLPRLPAP